MSSSTTVLFISYSRIFATNQSEIVMIKLYCCPDCCSRCPLLYYFFQISLGLRSSSPDSVKPQPTCKALYCTVQWIARARVYISTQPATIVSLNPHNGNVIKLHSLNIWLRFAGRLRFDSELNLPENLCTVLCRLVGRDPLCNYVLIAV